MESILDKVRAELRNRSDEAVRISGEGFFKEEVKIYGVKTAVVHRMSKEHYKLLPDKSKATVFALCEDLWTSGYNEEAFIACNWSYEVRKQFTPADLSTFQEWIEKYVTNWAACDTFCNHTVGELIEKYPECIETLKNWALSSNRWMRRAAAVSLIIPARKGKFLNDIFEIATLLLTDNDDMVQKGYGWMLKAASQAHQKEAYDFVIGNRTLMPRTAFRYAIEKMPEELRVEAMKK